MASRTVNATKNTKFAILERSVMLILNFISRTVFIKILGSTYLGINGLYSEILAGLSFAELGFGSALIYAMYSPVAKGDHEMTVKLLDFYKTVYRIIACVIAVFGLLLLPFLQFIVKGAEGLSLFELRLYFLIFLVNSVVSYFITYKTSYINALQKNYLITNINLVLNIITIISQIIVLFVFRNFLIYLLTQTFLLCVSRFVISKYLDRLFPILKEKPKEPLSKKEKEPIFNDVRGLIIHQFSSVAVHQTDNIIISSLTGAGVITVGFVSNYNMLMNAVLGFITQIFQSVVSGFGNLAATSSKERFRKVFLTANFINFWIYGFSCIVFFILIPPFITLWVGSDKLIDTISFLLIIINCYFQGQCTNFNNARIAVGNFNKDKWWALAQAIVNLLFSIWGARQFGLVGVYIGTVSSRLVFVLSRPYSTYSMMFGESCKEYYIMLLKYFLTVVFAGIISYFSTFSLLKNLSVGSFILSAVLIAFIPNIVFLLLTFRSDEFKDAVGRAKSIIQRKTGNPL